MEVRSVEKLKDAEVANAIKEHLQYLDSLLKRAASINMTVRSRIHTLTDSGSSSRTGALLGFEEAEIKQTLTY